MLKIIAQSIRGYFLSDIRTYNALLEHVSEWCHHRGKTAWKKCITIHRTVPLPKCRTNWFSESLGEKK